MSTPCKALLYNCPTCKRDFKRAERVPVCPGCGTDLHCKSWAIPGYNYCKNHGGPVPSRNFYGSGRAIVTGESSQFELTRLASKYVQMRSDGRILSNRASIEIIRDRIVELVRRAEENYAPDRIATLQKLWGEFLEAIAGDDKLEEIKIRNEITAEFEAAYHDYKAWEQIFQAMELDSKMVEREAKVAKDIHAIITAEDAYKLTAKLLGAIISSVQQQPEIPDEVKGRLLKRVEYEFTRIIGEGNNEAVGRGVGEVIDA